VLHVGIAFDAILLDPDAFGRAVTTFGALWRGPVNLIQHRVINIGPERAFNGLQIGLVAIRCELNAIGDARGHVFNEPFGALAIATADEMRNDEFRIGCRRRPQPDFSLRKPSYFWPL
jgi:hypothetical protein